ncbi:hypothetical protein P7H75_14180 [Vagococcus carniphilus]|uniref:hypothetical protein n=1 Tax=Vagococcus carniphilus TaxID=218144 RepID=UPI0028920F25|nr:hypothetical protein [Vagococcus carniphilus]MDT2816004.1 hypothetical protein [Vagococcus carniphilus]
MVDTYIVKVGNYYLRRMIPDKATQIDITSDKKEAYQFNTYIHAIVNSERVGGQVVKG